MGTVQDMLGSIRQRVREVTPDETREIHSKGNGTVIVDVRDKDEVDAGLIPGAVHLPKSFLELRVEQAIPERDTPIIAYCAGGVRSLLAADALQRLGYTNVSSMSGGFSRWQQQGHPVFKPKSLTTDQRNRYKRHLAIPEVGEAGQIKLLESKVLCIGAGGLGSPTALYLAAAGVGTLGVIDFDVVDESNLQRQIIHTADRVGTPKTESAKKTLLGLNPTINVVPHEDRLHSGNVEKYFSGYDIVVDGTDNFPTRYLVNDACVKLGIPNVHGSIYRFEGQVTVFHPPHGPCYRCLYPEPPPPELAPSCADAGVLGVLPGVVGVMEAVEVVKLILGVGEPLVGKLVHYDALDNEFRTLKLRRDPECAYCGDGKEFPGFIDYEFFCSNPNG
ncbi:MAG: molybdopterin-synthase adenylyltransferase MoeB [Myxococcales bacterium]|nr:molybdopterin-synthase adenylyltransferase MoeB [Myxococcales bacterium]